MELKAKSKTAQNLEEKVNVDGVTINELWDDVMEGPLSEESKNQKVDQQVKASQVRIAQIIAQKYGTFLGGVVQKLDGLGVYKARKLINREVKKLEKEYVALEMKIEASQGRYEDTLEQKMNSEEQKLKAITLYNIKKNMVEEMYEKRDGLEVELKEASAKATDPTDDSYLTIKKEINAIRTDVNRTERDINKIGGKIMHLDARVAQYDERLTFDEMRIKDAEDGLIFSEYVIGEMRPMGDDVASPIDTVKAVRNLVGKCKDAKKIIDAIKNEDIKIHRSFNDKRSDYMGQINGNVLHPETENLRKDINLRNDKIRNVVDQIIKRDGYAA